MARLLSYITLVLTVVWAGQAAGQSALERLEREIRSRLAAPAPGAPQPPPAAKQSPPAPPAAKADRQANAQDQPYLGAVTVDTLDRGRGVRVTEVVPGSPAQAAGIQPGDLLTGLGGVRIRTLEDFDEIMREVRPGMTLTVEVLRGKEPHKVNVTFARAEPAKHPAAVDRGNAKPKSDGNKPPAAPLDAAAGEKPGATPKVVWPAAPAPKIPPPPPEPAPPGPSPEARPKQGVAGGLPALVPPEKAKPAAAGQEGNVEARVSALEARLRQLEERLARIEGALRSKEEAKAKP